MKLLIFAWEYDGYHSNRGTALARRVRQVAEAFQANRWQVTVVHRDHRNECGTLPFKASVETSGVHRICVKLDRNIDDFNKIVLFRKIQTLYYVSFFGDRSYYWANQVIQNFENLPIGPKPDYILSFYTPRVTLYLGKYYSNLLGVPWVADLQDPIYQGISKISRLFCKHWITNTLKTARSVVHVSPEWAESDGRDIGRKIYSLRHALPMPIKPVLTDFGKEFKAKYGTCFNVFYGGSISAHIQSLELLNKVITAGKKSGITTNVFVGGNAQAHELFTAGLSNDVVKYLGWLNPNQMNEYIYACDCTLVIPWSQERVGIPSKFFELCSFDKPIWIIGDDLGGFRSLLDEWKHPDIKIKDEDFQQKALVAAATNKDFSMMFQIKNCKGDVVTVENLFYHYKKLFD